MICDDFSLLKHLFWRYVVFCMIVFFDTRKNLEQFEQNGILNWLSLQTILLYVSMPFLSTDQNHKLWLMIFKTNSFEDIQSIILTALSDL